MALRVFTHHVPMRYYTGKKDGRFVLFHESNKPTNFRVDHVITHIYSYVTGPGKTDHLGTKT